MTIRLIALWLLALAGLAGTPAGEWTVADARAAKAQPAASALAGAPRAERVAADRIGFERSILASDEADGTGDGSAASPAVAETPIQPAARESAIPIPDRIALGLPAGHSFSARAPPSA